MVKVKWFKIRPKPLVHGQSQMVQNQAKALGPWSKSNGSKSGQGLWSMVKVKWFKIRPKPLVHGQSQMVQNQAKALGPWSKSNGSKSGQSPLSFSDTLIRLQSKLGLLPKATGRPQRPQAGHTSCVCRSQSFSDTLIRMQSKLGLLPKATVRPHLLRLS